MTQIRVDFEDVETGVAAYRTTLAEKDQYLYLASPTFLKDLRVNPKNRVRIKAKDQFDITICDPEVRSFHPGKPIFIARPGVDLPEWDNAHRTHYALKPK